jgi:hypothetical protein
MDAGFGTFRQLLQYKIDRKAGYILYVDKWYLPQKPATAAGI